MMARIDHVALHVRNLEQACAFFVRYFGAETGAEYRNPKTGLRTFFLTIGSGCRLELMQRPQLVDAPRSPMRTGYIHLALSVGSREEVDRLTEELQSDGYEVLSGPRTTGDGYYESCIVGVEGNLIEITV